MSKISNLEANLELIYLAKSISCLDEFTKQFNKLVSSGCLTNVFGATIYTIAKLKHDNNISEKCMIICDKFNECYIIYLNTYSISVINLIEHISSKNIKQNVLHALLVRYMYTSNNIYSTKFVDIVDLDKLYLMFIEYSYITISHEYEQIYLYFKNNKVDIDKYNDIVVDNIISKGDKKLVDLNIFNFTPEQHNKLNPYGCLNTIDTHTLRQIMIDNNFNYNVVKHILDTNPNYTLDTFIYDDVMEYCSSKNISKNISNIYESLLSRGCYSQYINIVKYAVKNNTDISLYSLNTNYLDDYGVDDDLKLLINNVDAKPDDKKIYIPKYREDIVLPVKRYFNDDSYVNINIFLASIIGYEDEMIKVKDFRDIVKHKYNDCVYIPFYDMLVYIHIDDIYTEFSRVHIKTNNFIDYVLDKYSP